MNKPLTIFAGVVLVLGIGASTATAQASRWSAEGRLNTTIPLGDLSDEGAEAGLGLGADVFYTFIPGMSVYAGVSRHAFNCDAADCRDITSTGLQAGVKYILGAERRAMPWLRGGIMVHRADADGDDADLSLGAEAGAGIDFMLTPRFGLVPSLRYHTIKAKFAADELDMNYFTIALAGHFHFGR